MKPGAIDVVFQPIVEVVTGTVVAAEALACFPSRPQVPVDDVFCSARDAGWGADLEAVCLRIALDKRNELPPGIALAVNLSPNALSHPMVQWELAGDLHDVIIEVTEQAATESEVVTMALDELRERGAMVAMDDVTTGYSGLMRVSALRPDIVKIDRALVTGGRKSDSRRAVIEALVSLSQRIGAKTLGEGVETADDLAALAELNIDYAQGWATGRPAAVVPAVLPEVVQLSRAARVAMLRTPAGGHAPSGLSRLTAELAAATGFADLRHVIARAAEVLGVDAVDAYALGSDDRLRQIAAGDVAAREMPMPTATAEAHLNDTSSGPAERSMLAVTGFASLLTTPITRGGRVLGILELRHRLHRRWNTADIELARTVADHLAAVLHRIAVPADVSASEPDDPRNAG